MKALTIYTRNVLLGCFLLLCTKAVGQDIHFTQYYFAPINVNPALTGVFHGDSRVIGTYRNQWASVPVDYKTFMASFDTKLHSLRLNNGLVSVGGMFNYDRAGDSKMSWTSLNLTGSYTRTLNKNNFLSGGLLFDFGQRAFKTDELTFSNQYDGEIYNPSLSSNEVFNNTSKFVFKLGAGLNYHWQKSPRTKVDAGLGFMNLNGPEVNFLDRSVKLPARTNLFLQGAFQLRPKFDIIANFLGQIEGNYNEYLFGVALKNYVNQKRGNQLAVQLGLDFRFGDAFAPHIQVYWNEWRLGLSYDINTSDFNKATDSAGGPEFSVQYIITKVKPSEFKICPIY